MPETTVLDGPALRATANATAAGRLVTSDPVLVDIRPAGEVIPGMRPEVILTSGAPLPWGAYHGGQRRAIVGAAVFEGLAVDEADADRKLSAGEISVHAGHDHSTVGSLTGVCTWSMPTVVVRDVANGTVGYCRINEGPSTESLTFGAWSDGVRDRLAEIRDVVAPAFGTVVRSIGGIELRPVIRRALALGDDLHSRHTAAGSLLRNIVLEALLDSVGDLTDHERTALARYLREAEYLFLHLAMAAAKAAADAASNVPGSSVVTAMVLSECEFALRVSGLGDEWFRGALPDPSTLRGRLADGVDHHDLGYVGGESLITEVIGLGGMAAATAPALQNSSAGSARAMHDLTLAMYDITVTEHPNYLIPALDFRGVPVGIDAAAVAATGVVPAVHLGATLERGGHAGAVLFEPPLEPFVEASRALGALNTSNYLHKETV
ncbi:hypothetical protein CH275_21070 [Rhodococcus sp. 06-235-1A]|uniref:oxamate carbamoyltransferase subunit AllG family protein n=1 Tax=Rhodococcus sp. 06-235-1A TaxID=2022508 RepID=UPI000B9B8BB8|nr:DUF1116 domain-containing protein [Rhodococcus sp. 06-235-1A]OZD01207.1 hypothetical protein CH275_21070 [Rhodococcus sp. 06-235-1A]